MQQNLVSGVRGLDPKQAGGEIKDHDKMTPTYCMFAAAAAVTTYRTRANKGRGLYSRIIYPAQNNGVF